MDKFHAGRSNFSQTCNLLSQYLKENGGFGDLNFTPNFPQSSIGSVNPDQNPKAGKEIGQMTIFYAGKVIVLNDIPAEKAKEIINLATTTNNYAAVSPLGSDLPIARKNSLARFLEKRRDRVAGAAPYKASKPAVKAEPWLEMDRLQIQRN
ncbi:protein TIFY 10A-like [Salvia hispanica]|uniref:protein TIFY 10A-like n=1 Tax=Salvia hispanica TaxID=49212 RepID=UPI0020098B0A|nr:protein TIFY 10A-like [Salvia hispanica]